MKLYGYTSDAGGIRHALIADQDPGLGIDEARYFLLSCTSFRDWKTIKFSDRLRDECIGKD